MPQKTKQCLCSVACLISGKDYISKLFQGQAPNVERLLKLRGKPQGCISYIGLEDMKGMTTYYCTSNARILEYLIDRPLPYAT